MLKAARAHGMPMIVIAMMTAAISQHTAIHRPPNTIQKTLRIRDRADMDCSTRGARRPWVLKYAGRVPPDRPSRRSCRVRAPSSAIFVFCAIADENAGFEIDTVKRTAYY